MAKKKLDALIALFSRVTGKSEDELFIDLKANVIPRMKNPSGLEAEISESDYERIVNCTADDLPGILNWMLEGGEQGPPDMPEN